ncbi:MULTISPECIES: DUF1015 domain-containing protein [Listeria]|uniref:DUF1015 domain-containing protein n=1 Tax=Listeria TaxID=1637 RepID=UPI000B595F06|nr:MULTISPECIES: DUF1015 family protein [Listeria]
MVNVRPFQAVRPNENVANKMASLPYDVLSSAEARVLGDANEYSFLHIDKAEIDLEKSLSPYDDMVYLKAKENLRAFLQKEWLKKDVRAGFYIYELEMNGRTQTGIAATTAIDDYISGKIKKHEFTREEKELDRIRHVDTCDANTSPIFLTYRGKAEINAVIQQFKAENDPIYDFTSFHDVAHKVWHIDDADIVASISAAFASIPALYIADGHHRTESAVKVGLKRREAHPNEGPDAEFNFFLAVLFPAEELEILDYNRVLNVPIPTDFFDQLKARFDITEKQSAPFKPSAPKQIGLYTGGNWYGLTAKKSRIPNDVIGSLDVSILQNEVLTPIFDIRDIRRDDRIDFVGGIRGLSELEKRVDSGEFSIAFAMYPPTMNDLLSVADANEIMPPKSTWFEPKLLSGLFVHELESKLD